MATIIIIATPSVPPPSRGDVVTLTMWDGSVSGPFFVEDIGTSGQGESWTSIMRTRDGQSQVVQSTGISSISVGKEWDEIAERNKAQGFGLPPEATHDPHELRNPPPVYDDDVITNMNALVDRYISSRDSYDPASIRDKFVLFEMIWNHAYGTGTVGEYLMYMSRLNEKLRKTSQEDREAACRTFLEDVLKRAQQGGHFLGFLKENIKHLRHPDETWHERMYPKVLPYIEEFYRQRDAGLIPDDIRDSGTPNVVIWESFRRNEWNNYKTEDGKDRIQKAIKNFDAMVRGEISKEILSIQDPSMKASRLKELESLLLPVTGRGKFKAITTYLGRRKVSPVWDDKDSPYWLTGEMIEPSRHNLGPSQMVRFLKLFETQKPPGSVQSLEVRTPPRGTKPKDFINELSNDIRETNHAIEKVMGDEDEDEFVKDRAYDLRNRIRFISPDDPDKMRKIMEFIRDEYDDDDPKYAIANAFATIDIKPVPYGMKTKQRSVLRQQVEEKLLSIVNSPLFSRPRKDETFGLSPAQRFNIYLVEFIQDVKRLLMDDNVWSDLARNIGVVAHAIRAMIRTAMLFSRNIRASDYRYHVRS